MPPPSALGRSPAEATIAVLDMMEVTGVPVDIGIVNAALRVYGATLSAEDAIIQAKALQDEHDLVPNAGTYDTMIRMVHGVPDNSLMGMEGGCLVAIETMLNVRV